MGWGSIEKSKKYLPINLTGVDRGKGKVDSQGVEKTGVIYRIYPFKNLSWLFL